MGTKRADKDELKGMLAIVSFALISLSMLVCLSWGYWDKSGQP
ncbi:MAG: hypothetical protein ABI925_08765 [Verrucomicrobiota bacterium]